jgi:hypothetical protein
MQGKLKVPRTSKLSPTVLLLGGQQIVMSTMGSGEPLAADEDLKGVSGIVMESTGALVCWVMTTSLLRIAFSSCKETV